MRSRIEKLAVVAIVFALGLSMRAETSAGENTGHIVIFNTAREGSPDKNYPQYSFEKKFGVVEHRYAYAHEGERSTPAIDEKLIADLNKSKMLYIGKWAGGNAGYLFYKKPQYAEAIKNLLKRGGLIFFDYNGVSGLLKPFLDEI